MAVRRRNQNVVYLTGVKECDDLLKRIGKKIGNRAARTVMAKAFRIEAKSIKRQTQVKSVKQSIGSKVKTKRGKVEAKAGAAVGIKAATGVPKGGTRGGVGIAAANVHWYILGTAERRTKKGQSRGRMPPHDIVKQGASPQRVVNFIKKELPAEIDRLVKKERLKAAGRLLRK